MTDVQSLGDGTNLTAHSVLPPSHGFSRLRPCTTDNKGRKGTRRCPAITRAVARTPGTSAGDRRRNVCPMGVGAALPSGEHTGFVRKLLLDTTRNGSSPGPPKMPRGVQGTSLRARAPSASDGSAAVTNHAVELGRLADALCAELLRELGAQCASAANRHVNGSPLNISFLIVRLASFSLEPQLYPTCRDKSTSGQGQTWKRIVTTGMLRTPL